MGLFDSPSHILIVLVVLVLLFGSAKLPKLAKSLGESMRIFKKETQKLHGDESAEVVHTQVTTQQQLPPPPVAAAQPPASQPVASPQPAAAPPAPVPPAENAAAPVSTPAPEAPHSNHAG